MLIVCTRCLKEASLGWGFPVLMIAMVPLMAVIFGGLSWLLLRELQVGFGFMLVAIGLGSFLLAGCCCEGLLSLLCRCRSCSHCGARSWKRLRQHH